MTWHRCTCGVEYSTRLNDGACPWCGTMSVYRTLEALEERWWAAVQEKRRFDRDVDAALVPLEAASFRLLMRLRRLHYDLRAALVGNPLDDQKTP